MTHRVDNNTLRVILGNDIAVHAARNGNINPWPDGAILGKVVWKEKTLAAWDKAIVPGELVHAEFMFKDSGQYKESYGWGWHAGLVWSKSHLWKERDHVSPAIPR